MKINDVNDDVGVTDFSVLYNEEVTRAGNLTL